MRFPCSINEWLLRRAESAFNRLLRASGIPARYVSGFLPPGGQWGFDKQYWGVTIKSGGYHAWVEVYFPDQGWVFSDILHSLYFVDPYHLLFQYPWHRLESRL